MAIYFVTGPLGAGKTLVSIGHIGKYVNEGRRVACNLDIYTEHFTKKDIDLTRLPDKPTAENMEQLGLGYEGDKYDEKRSGLIVLDELGTWFNSRTWNEGKGERKKIMDWCLHARKLRWDIIFLVQDISIVDKQLRESLCEHLVICTRSDRYKLFGMHPPKWHKALVYYGDTESSYQVDKWLYLGKRFYNCYDTQQVFTDNQEHEGLSSVLPYRYTKKYLPVKVKRQIFTAEKLKTYLLVVLGISTIYSQYSLSNLSKEPGTNPGQEKINKILPDNPNVNLGNDEKESELDKYGYIRVSGQIKIGSKTTLFLETDQGNFTGSDLGKIGISIVRMANCVYRVRYRSESKIINCSFESDENRLARHNQKKEAKIF